MPAVTSGKILITGATGFIAAWTCEQALEKGYSVVGTVRSSAKGDYLKKRFAGKPFETVTVADISNPEAFDEVVSAHSFDAVLHLASPYHFDAKDPQELIKPAVHGTEGVLKAIKAHAPTVKRVVITSSIAAVTDGRDPPVTFTEADWNTSSTKIVEEKGRDADGTAKYRASKTYAERAAWKFMEEEKPKFDLAVINPGLVLGPILHYVAKEHELNTSVKQIWEISQGGKKTEDLPGFISNWVDVRDVAEAHVLALFDPEAAGQRFITAVGPFTTQQVHDILNKHDPSLKLVQGNADEGAKAIDSDHAPYMDGSKVSRVLGLKYHTLEDSIIDLYESVKARQAANWQ